MINLYQIKLFQGIPSAHTLQNVMCSQHWLCVAFHAHTKSKKRLHTHDESSILFMTSSAISAHTRQSTDQILKSCTAIYKLKTSY